MKIAKKPLSVAQARKALDRAKARGRKDEIASASGRLLAATQAESRAQQPAQPSRRAAAAADRKAGKALAAAAAELAALPVVSPRVDPAAAGRRGAAAAKLRRAEAAALRARVDLGRAKARPSRRRAQAELPELQAEPTQLGWADLERMERADALLAALAKLQPGQLAFGKAYEIAEPNTGQFFYGVDVQWDGQQVQYRWTGRAVDEADAKGDLDELRRSYIRKTGSDIPEDEEDADDEEPADFSYGAARAAAEAGQPFGLVVSVNRL